MGMTLEHCPWPDRLATATNQRKILSKGANSPTDYVSLEIGPILIVYLYPGYNKTYRTSL
jgi:hypothetical protein